MSLFNDEYHLFIKKLTDLDGYSLSSPQLRVKTFTIKRDLLRKATSSFEVLEIPSVLENGDVVGMYNEYGQIVYLGVCNFKEDNVIQTEQMYSIFDDSWLWNNPAQASIELTLKKIIEDDFQGNADTLMQTIYGAFSLSTVSATAQTLQSQEDRYVVSFADFLYDVYEKYGILLDFNIPYAPGTPAISIGKVSAAKLTLSNNTAIFRNFDIVKNVYETNKLIVYSESTGTYRETWYATTSGITNDSSSLNRLQKIKTNIIFSDDSISILKASSLRNEIYNHEITVDLVVDNNLMSTDMLTLGADADIYYNDEFYNSILTGYEMRYNNGVSGETINLKFGLVRTTLTNKLFKRLTK